MKCPLCSYEFDEKTEGCTKGCGMKGSSCTLICCPHCHYSFVQESRLIGFIKRWWRKEKGHG